MTLKQLLAIATLAVATIAQTIKVEDQELLADQSTVSPAGEAILMTASQSDAELTPDEIFQLTDAVLANLTDLQLTNISLFTFDDGASSIEKRTFFSKCKTAPGDLFFPGPLVWKVFDLLVGGALKKTIPYASVCYESFGNYDKAKCDFITANWFNGSYIQAEDRTSINAVLFQDLTCVPPSLFAAGTSCTIGGYPLYSVDARNVAHIQLAINFARNLNLRLVIKNTGHDFGAKSTGYGALSIWTHNLKTVKFYKSYTDGSYSGPAFRLGAGVQAFEVYEAAHKYGVTVVGGEGQTVGVMGGYVQGGGHSPLSGLYGMSSDSVLSFQVVTADGRYVTASEEINPDLFWAIRGGGGSTYGVVTSAVVKAHPKMDSVTTMTFSFTSGVGNVTDDMFWRAVKAFWVRFPEYARENANYEYFFIQNIGTGFSFSMAPWFAPEFTEAQLRKLAAPLFADWRKIGINVEPAYKEYNDFYSAWQGSFPLEPWGSSTIRQGSRLFPEENWADDEITQKTFEAVKSSIEDGNYLIAFNIWAGVKDYPDSAVNPAWRKALVHAIGAAMWDDAADEATKKTASDKLTFDWIQRWRDVSPTGGAYMSESDYIEPDFQRAFWGGNYKRALELKQKWDPKDVFYATNAVGSEKWELQDKIFGNIPNQNSKLCRV